VRDAIAFPLARRGSFGVRAAAAVSLPSAQRSVDVRRRFGRLPADQDDLEAWLTGHCERVAARGPRSLSPAVVRFQELIERDAVVRMYLELRSRACSTSGRSSCAVPRRSPCSMSHRPAGCAPRRRRRSGSRSSSTTPTTDPWGFTSWNDFFTRRFRAGQRPVAAPDDDTIIVSAWEAFVLIEADDPTIGLVAFVPIDMSEGSSCLPTARVRTELAAAQRA